MSAPSAANRVAIAAPIPREPPVIKTRLPLRVDAFRMAEGNSIMRLGMKTFPNISIEVRLSPLAMSEAEDLKSCCICA